MAELNQAGGTKDPNPKDAVGVRKASLSCVPKAPLLELAVAMQEGARKYGRHNYRAANVQVMIYVDAAHRHLFDFEEGVDIDPDSDVHHVTKAIATLVVLRDAMLQGKAIDDRPPKSKFRVKDANKMAAAVVDRYPDAKTPFTEVSVSADRPAPPRPRVKDPEVRFDPQLNVETP